MRRLVATSLLLICSGLLSGCGLLGDEYTDVRIDATYDGEPAALFARILVHQPTLYQAQLVLLDGDAKKPPARYWKILKSLSFT